VGLREQVGHPEAFQVQRPIAICARQAVRLRLALLATNEMIIDLTLCAQDSGCR
jgi:hypothetical protein